MNLSDEARDLMENLQAVYPKSLIYPINRDGLELVMAGLAFYWQDFTSPKDANFSQYCLVLKAVQRPTEALL